MISIVITKFLTDSFKLLQAQGKSPQEIRTILLAGDYLPEDISALFSQYQQSPTTLPQSTPPAPTHLSKIILILGILFIFESVNFYSQIVTSTIAFSSIIKAYIKTNTLVDVFIYNPLLAGTPLLYAFLGSLFLYAGFTLLTSSSRSRTFSLILLIISLIILPIFNYFTTYPHLFVLTHFLNENTVSLLLLILFLLFTTHKFNKDSQRLSILPQILILSVSLLSLSLSTFVTTTALNAKSNTDSNLATLASDVQHKIYQPTYLPDKFTRLTKFYSPDQPLLQDFITLRTHYGFDTKTQQDTQLHPLPLVFDQSATVSDFSLDHYITTLPVASTPQVVNINNTRITRAFYFTSQSGATTTQFLYFANTANTLFLLTTSDPSLTQSDLLNVAAGIL